MQGFKNGDKLKEILWCNHLYHPKCLRDLILENITDPTCKLCSCHVKAL